MSLNNILNLQRFHGRIHCGVNILLQGNINGWHANCSSQYSTRVFRVNIYSQMTLVNSFTFSARPDAEVLILGSMPGIASLQQQEYYAHPRNVFWDFMEKLFAISRTDPYETRLQQLHRHKVALWDVAQQCRREGSLDSNIKGDSVLPNDIAALLEYCPKIHTVFFNGRKSEEMFNKLVLPTLEKKYASLSYRTLPSTSPANASLSSDKKFQSWLLVRQVLSR